MSFRLRTGALLILLPLVAACSSTSRVRHTTPEEAFQKGQAALEQRKYERAIEFFRGVLDYGRTAANEWADDAQLGLARAYFRSKQYILAATEYTRFSELYRADPRAVDAEYERALAYERLSPGYELDQTNTERALTYLRLFVERYPESPRTAEAEAKILELRSKLARKAFESARLYERRELFEAAAMTYEKAFAEYPDAAYADDALVGALRMYLRYAERSVEARKAERLQKAADHYTRLLELFPQSPLRAEAETLYAEVQARQAELGTTARR
jgi:outer membrane protein assembly factor BamD